MAKRKKRTAKPKQPDAEIVEKAVILRVTLRGDQPTLAALTDRLGLSPKNAQAALEAAHRRLIQEAGADRVQEFGTAVEAYRECYKRAIQLADVKTALQAQNSLTKLWGFETSPAVPNDAHNDADAQLQEIRGHLAPLRLAGDATPDTATADLARIAAARLTEHAETPRP